MNYYHNLKSVNKNLKYLKILTNSPMFSLNHTVEMEGFFFAIAVVFKFGHNFFEIFFNMPHATNAITWQWSSN